MKKIYDLFKKGVLELTKDSNLKFAWFTTYNLEIDFIEDYILPVLAGMEGGRNYRPRTGRDYEEIQANLIEKKTDIKFFADEGMIDYNGGKNTPVSIIDVQTSRIGNNFKYGVFHPKVIFLVNEKGEVWLMTGSANLTAAAWSLNRESIWCGRVDDRENQKAIIQFFKNIMDSKRYPFPSDDMILHSIKERQNEWKFVSSILSLNTLEDLIGTDDQTVIVYSPYFSENIKNFCQNDTLRRLKNILLVPDVNENNKMRILNDNYLNASTDPRIYFKRTIYDDDTSEVHRFTHAKVWVTESRISIGSWNFTGAGTGRIEDFSKTGANNIEAGVVINTPNEKHLQSFMPPKEEFDADPMQADELESEKDQPGLKIDFLITVQVDWDKKSYMIVTNDLEENKATEMILVLPDQEIDLNRLLGGFLEIGIKDQKRLLKNHLFYIKSSNNSDVYVGIIYETGQSCRPVWRFDSFQELLYSFMQDDPNKYESHRLNYNDNDITGEDGNEQTNPLGISANDQTYYTLFSAFYNLKKKFGEISPENIRMYIDILPGCIVEISEKSKSELEKHEFSDVWKWFLVEEVNAVIEMAKNKIDNKRPDYKYLMNILLESRLDYSLLKPENINSSQWRNWIKYIREECDYAS